MRGSRVADARPTLQLSYEPGEALRRQAAELASELGLPLIEPEAARAWRGLLLVCTAGGLALEDRGPRPRVRLLPDYGPKRLPRLCRSMTRRHPLARALGSEARTVVDATAGLGHDALMLACRGYAVAAVERCPPIAALLADAIARARAAGALDSLHIALHAGDARHLQPLLAAADVIYLDPMYPPKRKRSAATRKEMRLLRALAGPDDDADDLFAAALQHARRRVVVKRTPDAPALDPRPHTSVRGNLVRYDVYRSAWAP